MTYRGFVALGLDSLLLFLLLLSSAYLASDFRCNIFDEEHDYLFSHVDLFEHSDPEELKRSHPLHRTSVDRRVCKRP